MQDLVEARTERSKIDDVSPLVWGAAADVDKKVIYNLERVAKEHNRSMAVEALAWMLSKLGVTAPIVGTTSVKHVEEAGLKSTCM